MPVLRFDRFTSDPDRTGELLARRATLVAAVRTAVPGLIQTRLTRIDERTWVDTWLWESKEAALAAVAQARAGAIPEVPAAFALTTDMTTEFAEVVDER